jgi:hypothetical protein
MATVLQFPTPAPVEEPQLTTPELAKLAVGLYVEAIRDMRYRYTKIDHINKFRAFLADQVKELDLLDAEMAADALR